MRQWLGRGPRWRRYTVAAAALGAGAIACVLVAIAIAASLVRTHGGVDTGLPGSRCAPRVHRLSSPPEPGTRAGTFSGDYYELGLPTPRESGAPLMLILHGGAWVDVGPGQVQAVRGEADRWRRLGWQTLNFDYRACGHALTDVVAFYDHFRGLAGGHPICAEGLSGGGQLAMILAVDRPRVRCVIGLAVLTDLPALRTQRTSPASSALTGAPTTAGPRFAYYAAVAAFGREQLPAMSAALQANRIKARVLLAVGANDIFVPWAQAREFWQRRPRNTVILELPIGRIPWLHGTTTRHGLQQVAAAERQLTSGLR